MKQHKWYLWTNGRMIACVVKMGKEFCKIKKRYLLAFYLGLKPVPLSLIYLWHKITSFKAITLKFFEDCLLA